MSVKNIRNIVVTFSEKKRLKRRGHNYGEKSKVVNIVSFDMGIALLKLDKYIESIEYISNTFKKYVHYTYYVIIG